MGQAVYAATEECRAWAAMFDVTIIEPNNGSEWVTLEKMRGLVRYECMVRYNDLAAWKTAISHLLDL